MFISTNLSAASVVSVLEETKFMRLGGGFTGFTLPVNKALILPTRYNSLKTFSLRGRAATVPGRWSFGKPSTK